MPIYIKNIILKHKKRENKNYKLQNLLSKLPFKNTFSFTARMRIIPLLLVLVCKAATEEKWSWGVHQNDKRPSPSSKIVFHDAKSLDKAQVTLLQERKIAQPPTSTTPSNRQARKIEVSPTSNSKNEKVGTETEPRFFGLKKQLCKHGLGINVSLLSE